MMTGPTNRIHVEEHGDDFIVRIGPWRTLDAWSAFVIQVPVIYYVGRAIAAFHSALVLYACLLFSLPLVAVGLLFAWNAWSQMFGHESIVLSNGRLAFSMNLGPIRIGPSFDVSQIENLRVEERTFRRRGNEWLRRKICFEVNGRTRANWRHLTAEEGAFLLPGPLARLRLETEPTNAI